MRGAVVAFGELRALALFLLAQFGRELGAEILRLVHLAQLDFAVALLEGARAALEPLQRFFFRFALPQPEAGDQLLGLGKRAVDDAALVAADFQARTLG